VVLEHVGQRGVHWDFMLQRGAVLRTWALSAAPTAAEEIAAEALADHPLAYLELEGPVAGGRGSVTRWDQGTYELLQESAAGLEVRLVGNRLIGRARLSRSDTGWRFRLE